MTRGENSKTASIYYPAAAFMTSAHTLVQMPPDRGSEVAFAGRSNAGKSSALNCITGRRGLARISREPGRTRLLNFFALDGGQRLVDLPGFGYARVSQQQRQHWDRLLSGYLETRRSLRGLILVMDIRHPLKEYDLQMLDWCRVNGLPVHILLTKADKLSRSRALEASRQVRQALDRQHAHVSLQLFSARQPAGVDECRQVLNEWFAGDKKRPR